MVEALWQTVSSGVLRVVLPLTALIVVTIVALKLVDVAATQVDKRLIEPADEGDRRARLQTLRKVAKATARALILAVAALIGLGTVGIDIGPALAAVGVLGLAVSLGAQTLIKDVIGGLTILIEDEYRVGDAVKIGSVSGDVERITLRRTDIRDAEGRLFMIPNGDVRTAANETREWARALVELNFGYEADVRKAVSILQAALAKLGSDPSVKTALLGDPEVFGWQALSDWSVIVRLRAKVIAGRQNEVARAMRRDAIEALNAAGVPVASHRRLLLQGDGRFAALDEDM